jgi:hypothetical protein
MKKLIGIVILIFSGVISNAKAMPHLPRPRMELPVVVQNDWAEMILVAIISGLVMFFVGLYFGKRSISKDGISLVQTSGWFRMNQPPDFFV